MTISNEQLTGLILAGGMGSRMGYAEKPLLKLGNKTILQWIFSKSENQVGQFLISLNRNQDRYESIGYPLIQDIDGYKSGPLIGIYSALEFLSQSTELKVPHYLLCLPGDVPFFPNDLINQLSNEMASSPCDVVMTKCDSQLQPLFSLWALSTKQKIKKALENGYYGPKQILSKLDHKLLYVEAQSALQFFNINTVKDMKIAQKLINDL